MVRRHQEDNEGVGNVALKAMRTSDTVYSMLFYTPVSCHALIPLWAASDRKPEKLDLFHHRRNEP
jgi:hypothetical protein